ncbi:MAG: methyltransferase [Candidatus Hodarchaeota archaeon]
MQTIKDEVLHQLRSYINSAALGAALELGLFWKLEKQPQDAASIANRLGIPVLRCQKWLTLLKYMGYLEKVSETYIPSSKSQESILNAYSQQTWSFLAQEARERLPAVQDLAFHIGKPISTWAAQGLSRPNYVALMKGNPERAQRFTRMLFEIHRPLADELANSLDLKGVKRLMDLGGGSGVQSFALLQRYPHLTSIVVDIQNVCVAGRKIAAELSLEERISFYPADFLQDELPKGFDLVLECDVGIYNEALFRKIRTSLNPGGRFIIVDELVQGQNDAISSDFTLTGRGQVHDFLSSLEDPKYESPTAMDVKAKLSQAGYELISENTISNSMLIIQAQK